MKRDELMTWNGHSGTGRWKKQYRKNWYRVRNSELKEQYPHLFFTDCREGSRLAANQWWTEKVNEIHKSESSSGLSAERVALLIHHELKNIAKKIGSSVLADVTDKRINYLKGVVSEGERVQGLSLNEATGNEDHISELLKIESGSDHAPSTLELRAREILLKHVIDGLCSFDGVLPVQAVAGTTSGSQEYDRSIHTVSNRYLNELIIRTDPANGAKPLSVGRYEEIRGGLRYLKETVGAYLSIDELAKPERISGYYQSLLKEIKNEVIAAGTGRSRLVVAQQFLKWCWQNGVIDELPRNLSTLTISVERKEPKLFDLELFRAIYHAGTDRTKLYMALIANTGMRNSDIASLTLKQYDRETGRLSHSRIKTKAKNPPRVNYLLWEETRRLLEQHIRTDPRILGPDDPLFINKDGLPITRSWLNDDGKRQNVDAIFLAFKRATKKAGLKGRDKPTLSMVRTTSSNFIRKEYGWELQTLFLGNRANDVSTRHYTSSHDDFRLDEPLKWLETRYQLGNKQN